MVPQARRLPGDGAVRPVGATVPYAELHTHSAFSFLDGASPPEELVEEAVRLGLDAIALTDHDGMYGVVRFAEAAKELGMRTVFGAELSLDATPRTGTPDPAARIFWCWLAGRKVPAAVAADCGRAPGRWGEGQARYDYDALTEAAGGHWQILTGCRKGHCAVHSPQAGPTPPKLRCATSSTGSGPIGSPSNSPIAACRRTTRSTRRSRKSPRDNSFP